jgi:outer membrane protein OmpA-like peptidoglycan-associated protein
MLKPIAAVLLVGSGWMAEAAFSQTQAPPNPTQQPVVTEGQQAQQVPVFRLTVVGRTTPAVNYRPRRGDTKVDFVGTALLPRARGNAEISGEKGYMKIDARFDKLEAPSRYGPEYVTYVLWAVTPEGRATNLGEVQYDDDDARVQVTTELQAFGLIVTAEPYFAVTQPSDVVVIENEIRDGTNGRGEVIQAKYELLKRGTYLMNQDARRLKIKALEPGAPLDLAEARNAVALARIAGADRYAVDTFAKAEKLLNEAEVARERRRRGDAVMQPARQAVQTAEDARLIALQKQEEEYNAQQRALAAQREREAQERARAEEDRRRQAELAAQTEEMRRRQAEIAAQAEEARRRQAEIDAQAAAASRAAAERERANAEAARAAADAARLAAEAQASAAQAAKEASDREKAELREQLRVQLNAVLETRETARGLIVNVSDVLFDFDRATLKPGAREKLARVAGILLTQRGLNIAVEGHTDSVGSDGYNQRLSEQRAASVRDYLVSQGIQPGAVATAGFGESQPVVSNDTAAGRQQNRRVELVVSGEAIARR